ncbi:MAG: hypothetical protein WCG93_00860, partial [Paludibacter sp.]
AEFIKDKAYIGKIIKDENENKIFAVFKVESIIQLKEINILTGELKPQIIIPNFPFIENINKGTVDVVTLGSSKYVVDSDLNITN